MSLRESTAIAEAAPHAVYLDHLKRGELAYQFSPSAGRALSLSLGLSPLYCSEALEWRIASGLGTVYRTTVVAQRDGGEYSVSLIDCDEGFRLMSRVEGVAAHDVHIGMRVRFQLNESMDDEPYPVFVPLLTS